MRTLLLVRHAKSSWSDFSLPDFDRPLNDRGKRDAPVMARRMRDKGVQIDAFISSPAKRAFKTASIFAKEYGREKSDIILIQELYLAVPAVFLRVIEQAADKHQTIAVFSHNNGITDFANELTDARIDEIQTCGIFAVKVDAGSWKDFAGARKEFWFYDSPKVGG